MLKTAEQSFTYNSDGEYIFFYLKKKWRNFLIEWTNESNCRTYSQFKDPFLANSANTFI